MLIRRLAIAALASFTVGCATEVTYQPEYLVDPIPSYLAETQILILMDNADLEYVYEGTADSFIGQNVTLRMPIGAITREIAASVFQSHFNYGVVFAPSPPPDVRYVVAIAPEIRDFSYRYDQYVDQNIVEMRPLDAGGLEAIPATVITPSIQFELALRAFDPAGDVVLERVYDSGLVSGQSYYVTSRPHERINATFHSTLQDMMLTVADDLQPILRSMPNVIGSE